MVKSFPDTESLDDESEPDVDFEEYEEQMEFEE